MKNVLEIDINSPIFAQALKTLDKEIKRVIEKLHDEEFASGEITLKLDLALIEDSKEFPKEDELGLSESEFYYYKRPQFKHSVSTTLKQQYKETGTYTDEREVKLIDDNYVLVPVEEPQLNFLG